MKKNLVTVILALILSIFFMFLGVSEGSIGCFLFGLLFILALPGTMKRIKKVIHFTCAISFVTLIGMGISSLSFPLLGILASGYLILKSSPKEWGFTEAPLLPLELAKE